MLNYLLTWSLSSGSAKERKALCNLRKQDNYIFKKSSSKTSHLVLLNTQWNDQKIIHRLTILLSNFLKNLLILAKFFMSWNKFKTTYLSSIWYSLKIPAHTKTISEQEPPEMNWNKLEPNGT